MPHDPHVLESRIPRNLSTADASCWYITNCPEHRPPLVLSLDENRHLHMPPAKTSSSTVVDPWIVTTIWPLSSCRPKALPQLAWDVLNGKFTHHPPNPHESALELMVIHDDIACMALSEKANAVHGDVSPSKMGYIQWNGGAHGVLIDYDVFVCRFGMAEDEKAATGGISY
ncbi:hypothetical protein D9611_003756 [Ephemerocybe angulata]|uniref:Uncharacterized protein n=1 Tax=Ephemerocybe angulata TaxID=980116 RepID=A0A8H5B5K7_9AGAR|nr:hypothetical protein D9611_003756 [Tulosesus angulatus]